VKREQALMQPEGRPASLEVTGGFKSYWTANHALWLLAVVAALFVIRAAASVLVPIVVGVLMSYVLDQVVTWLERHKVPRLAGAALTLVAAVAVVAAVVYLLSGQLQNALAEIPQAIERLRSSVREFAGAELLESATSGQSQAVSQFIGWTATSLMTLVSDVTIVLFLVFFLLLDGDHFCRRATEIAGGSGQVLADINAQIQRFLIVRLVTAVIVGVATWVVLALMSVPQAVVWAVLAGVVNSVPYFGPVIVSGGLFVIGLGESGDLTRALEISGAALVITSLEGWLITPPLLGKVESMNATVVFVGLLMWTWLWGAWGALLGVPMLVVIKAVADHAPGLRPLARLMAR
jgi:predicted PurR-regulated permease PerM